MGPELLDILCMNMSVKQNLENCQYHRREGDDLLMEYLTIVIERVTILG